MASCEYELYVVGHPVAHSKSPAMHNAAYKALGLPWHYGRKDIRTDAEALRFFERGSWFALNITTPYKEIAFSSAQQPTIYASMAQGANVLVPTEQGLYADNTDGRGCISYLQRCGCSFEGSRVVVCGTGPTSQSILYAALRAGADELYLLGRNDARSRAALTAFMERLGDASSSSCLQAGSYERYLAAIEAADVIIDATTLGMKQDDPAPFDTKCLHEGQYVFDVVYGHGVTKIIADARKAGCKTFDGSGMLVAQAIETIYDIDNVLDLSLNLDSVDLFSIMSEAAGFSVAP